MIDAALTHRSRGGHQTLKEGPRPRRAAGRRRRRAARRVAISETAVRGGRWVVAEKASPDLSVVLLAIQVLFLLWVIAGLANSATSDDCRGMTGDELELCRDAGFIGTTTGAGLLVGLWVAVDVILGFSYLIYWACQST
ncbi:hypothetical protein GCM10009601_63710 [Streptomyces thermospinosisporus]|uniref:Uncharacterized protein n=1 Tax=Streptomyces thermospinosisporus TaxID=161482 RepID=A0ABP4K119_9ACTN